MYDQHQSKKWAAIAGVSTAIIFGICGLLGLHYHYCKKRHKKHNKANTQPRTTDELASLTEPMTGRYTGLEDEPDIYNNIEDASKEDWFEQTNDYQLEQIESTHTAPYIDSNIIRNSLSNLSFLVNQHNLPANHQNDHYYNDSDEDSTSLEEGFAYYRLPSR